VTVVVYPEGVWYGGVRKENVAQIVEEHIGRGCPVERLKLRLASSEGGEGESSNR
jgi:(2Fe-2S) ferredoxin